MTPADRRITELIDKWLASIDLHLQYVELSDAAYARVQPWQKHDRPTRWVLEVARQKVLELKQHCETRQAMGDARFSESLELMAFLANLVGIQHIQRFIPLADPAKADIANGTSQTIEAPTVIRTASRIRMPVEEPTREMPQLKAVLIKPAEISSEDLLQPIAVPPRQIPSARSSAPKINPAAVQPAAKAAARQPAAAAEPAPKPSAPLDLKGKIIADAIRLLKWGKSWHELADLIARIAERPSAVEIRKVLRTHKSEIEKAAQL